MPYKPSLMTTLAADYEDAARKYMEARDENAELAECYLNRMRVIGKDMEITQKMIDGTLGRAPHAHTAPAAPMTARTPLT